jgi:hypothetical protein
MRAGRSNGSRRGGVLIPFGYGVEERVGETVGRRLDGERGG